VLLGRRRFVASDTERPGRSSVSAPQGDQVAVAAAYRAFHPAVSVWFRVQIPCQVGVFSPVRRRVMRSVMAMWIMAVELAGRVS
jgi:hypothetical protein